MAEIKPGDRIVWARSNDGAEQTGQVAAGGRILWFRTDCLAWASARVKGG